MVLATLTLATLAAAHDPIAAELEEASVRRRLRHGRHYYGPHRPYGWPRRRRHYFYRRHRYWPRMYFRPYYPRTVIPIEYADSGFSTEFDPAKFLAFAAAEAGKHAGPVTAEGDDAAAPAAPADPEPAAAPSDGGEDADPGEAEGEDEAPAEPGFDPADDADGEFGPPPPEAITADYVKDMVAAMQADGLSDEQIKQQLDYLAEDVAAGLEEQDATVQEIKEKLASLAAAAAEAMGNADSAETSE